MGGKPSVPEVARLPSDKTFLITGGNTGMGYTTAKTIAQLGGRVIIACRNEEKAKKAIEEMKADTLKEFAEFKENKENKLSAAFSEDEIPKLNVQYMLLDLSSLSSVMGFVRNYNDSGLPLHVLICNAGALFQKLEITDGGYEKHFQVNYLSHFLLTLRLLPLLKSSGPNCRIINVSSLGHNFTAVNFNELQSTSNYSSGKYYGNSKLFQIMSMYSLSNLLPKDSVSVFSLHPGFIETNIINYSTGVKKYLVNALVAMGASNDVSYGSASSLMFALDPNYNGQTAIYLSEGKVKTPSSTSRNKTKQDLLWKYSLKCLKDYLPEELVQQIGMKTPSNSANSTQREYQPDIGIKSTSSPDNGEGTTATGGSFKDDITEDGKAINPIKNNVDVNKSEKQSPAEAKAAQSSE